MCGIRGLEMKQLIKSKPAVYGRGLLISLATAPGEQQGTVVCDQSLLWCSAHTRGTLGEPHQH